MVQPASAGGIPGEERLPRRLQGFERGKEGCEQVKGSREKGGSRDKGTTQGQRNYVYGNCYVPGRGLHLSACLFHAKTHTDTNTRQGCEI